MPTVLGLDLGPNSIGWALIENSEGAGGRLIDCGVRVFPEGVDAFDTAKEKSRGEQRRTARMMRRQIRRRAQRKRIVLAALVEMGLMPADPVARQAVLKLDPYPLRVAALSRRLEAFEIGRIFYHLNQRRGFLSLKKVSKAKVEKELKAIEKKRSTAAESAATTTEGDGAVKKEDESKLLASIELLARRIGEGTLGQTLHQQQSGGAAVTTAGGTIPPRIRNQHTRRSMIEDEFLRIWQYQSAHHPELLNDTTCFGSIGRQDAQRTRTPTARRKDQSRLQQFGLHGLIFHQRPIYWPREMIGMCDLEKKQRRCPRADRRAQRFRMLQEINNLRYTLPGHFEEKALDPQQRAALLERLYATEKLTFDQIRSRLELIDSVQFNLERGKRGGIKGCETDVRLARECKRWSKLDEALKDRLVRVLIEAERDVVAAREKLLDGTGLSPDEADALLSVDLPQGYTRVSLMAINKLLPHLEKGMILMGKSAADASAMHAAGYLRRDELQRRLFDQLPSLRTIHAGPLADLPNPVVRAALHELRRVVNAIVREYGRPDAVHVEMARSMKMGQKARREYNERIRQRGDEREKIAAELRAARIVPTRDAVLKYRLWQEQKTRCVYTGRSISFEQLYDGSTDIDHILPYSLTLDDSQMNKVVCFRDANREKGQRSPWQWLAGTDKARLELIEQRGQCLPWTKRRKLVQQEITTDEFIARQLVDTGYIARLAVVYLEMLVQNKHDVQGRKGTYTADLRHHWGLGNVIESLPGSPAWEAKADLSPGEKNRADHRHHALDAIVIALTSRRTLAAMHQGKETVEHVDRETGEWIEYQRFTKDIPPPWGLDAGAFRQLVLTRLSSVNVSHRVRRKVRGALHEDTLYGPTKNARGEVVPDEFVIRKPVDALSLNEIARIRDKAIRELVVKRFSDAGIAVGHGGGKVAPKRIQEILLGLAMPSGVPIKRVRLLKVDSTIRSRGDHRSQTAFVRPGRNHHATLFEWMENGKTRREAIYVNRMEAARRIRCREPIVRHVHPERTQAKFLMSICLGDTLLLEKGDGSQELVVVTSLVAGEDQKRIHAVSAYDARRSSERPNPSITGQLLSIRKVTVDPLGRIRWAND